MASKTKKIADEIAGRCIAFQARCLSRDITNLYDESLRHLDIRSTQMSILVAIAKMEEANPGEIGLKLHLERSTVSRALQRLKEREWVEEIENEDARSRPVRLTNEGEKLLQKAHVVWQDVQKKGQEMIAHSSVAQMVCDYKSPKNTEN